MVCVWSRSTELLTITLEDCCVLQLLGWDGTGLQRLPNWGDEFDCEVSVPPAFDFACFQGILFKKAYYLKVTLSGLKLIKIVLSSPNLGKNITILKLFASNPI